jgi:hypothetical protein
MADVTISVSLNVTPLTDNAVWFANAAAWNNYWAGSDFTGTVPVAGLGVYGIVQTATTAAYAVPGNVATGYTILQMDLTGNGVLTNVPVPNQAVIEALASNLNSLMADYAATKLALKNAGIVSAN